MLDTWLKDDIIIKENKKGGKNMSVKIRMQRVGRHKLAKYRIVVADSHYPRDGRFIEILGTYDPTANPAKVTIDTEKAYAWLKQGAIPSDTVKSFLSKEGLLTKLHEEKFAKKEVKK